MMADPFAYDENMARWAKDHKQNSWQKARMPADNPQQGLMSALKGLAGLQPNDAQQPTLTPAPAQQPEQQRPPSPTQMPTVSTPAPTVTINTPTVSPSSMTQYYDQFNQDNNTTLGYRDGGPIRGPKGDDQVPGLMPDGEPVRLQDGGYVLPLLVVDVLGGPQTLDKLVASIAGNQRDGGPIRGPKGDDQVPGLMPGGEPARLQDGEYELPASVVDALGGPQTLDKLVASITGNQPGPVEKPPLPGQKPDMPPVPPVDTEGYKCGGSVKAMADGGFLERFKNRAGKINAAVDAATGAPGNAPPPAPPAAPQEEKFVPRPSEFDREAFMRELYGKPAKKAPAYADGGVVNSYAGNSFFKPFMHRAKTIDAAVDDATGAPPSAPKAPPPAPKTEEKFVPRPGEFDREAFMRELYGKPAKKAPAYADDGMVKSYAAGGSSEFDETPADRYGVSRFGDQGRALARQERDLPGVAQDTKAAGIGYGGVQMIQNLRARREYALKPDKPTPAPKYRGNPPSDKPAAPVTLGTRPSDYNNADYSKLPPPAAPPQTPPSARLTQGVWYEGPGSGKGSSVGLSGDTMTAANARLRELTGGQAGAYMGMPPASPGGAPNYGPTDHERRMAGIEATASLEAARKLAGMAPNERGRVGADQLIGTQHRDNLTTAQQREMGVRAAIDLERAKQGPPQPPSAADQLKQRDLENYDRDRLSRGIAEIFEGSAEMDPAKTQAKQGMFVNAATRIANEYNVDPDMLLSNIRTLNLSAPPLLPPDEWAETDEGKALTKQAEAARKAGRAVPNPYAQYMQEYNATLYDRLLASLTQ